MLYNADRIVVMRDGQIAAAGTSGSFTRDTLVAAMGGGEAREAAAKAAAGERKARPLRVRARPARQSDGAQLVAGEGEIVGLAGLSGHGQTDLLLAIFAASARPLGGIEVTAPVALVAGDRQVDGIFPLWSIAQNIGISSLAKLQSGVLISAAREAEIAAYWQRRIGIRTPDMENNILSLSGGNQQKALFARALASDARIVLMDDPTRGVDVGTKLEVYDLISEEARGRAHLPLVHDRDGRAEQLRPRLCVPERTHRRRSASRRADGGTRSPVLVQRCGLR